MNCLHRLSRGIVLLTSLTAIAVSAQDFPKRKPIRLIVSGPVASSTDMVARALADGLDSALDQRIVVENKPTANGAIAGAEVARAAPDGYTLVLMVTASMVINPHLNRSLGWNPVKDFTAIGEVGTTAAVLAVRADSPYASFSEVLVDAKAKPDRLKWGLLNFTLSHFIALSLKDEVGADFTIIPFSSQSQMISALMAGEVDMVSTGAASLLPFFATKKFKPLMVTSDERDESLPSTPTLAEFVPGSSTPNWFGLFGPAGMNPKVVSALNKALNETLAKPKFRQQLKNFGTEPTGGGPEVMANRVSTDLARYQKIVSRSGLKVQ